MTEPATDATVALSQTVHQFLTARGVSSALIGAMALAAHRYVRATTDIDLAVVSDLATLRELTRGLREALDAEVTFIEPDPDDHLGGVITIRKAGFLPIQVVNFVNEKRARNRNPGLEAIKTRILDPAFIDVVDLPHLVALKVWAGGPKSSHDVLSLLEVNPGADLAAIDDVCARFGLTEAWLKLRPTTAPTGP